MKKEKLVQLLLDYVGENFLDGDAADLDAFTPLLELRILDSFSTIQLLSFIESEHGITVPLEALTPENISCIDSIADLFLSSQSDSDND